MRHLLLSQKFLPEFGGSIRWMFEAYRRWPQPVRVITHDYYNDPPRTPEFPDQPTLPAQGDPGEVGALSVRREPIFLHDWGLDHPSKWARYARMTRAVAQEFRTFQGGVAGGSLTVHCTHALPEVLSVLPLRWRYGKRKLRVVCYAHGEEITACLGSRQLNLLMRRAHQGIDLMLANSAFTQNKLRGLIDMDKVQVMHPGVDLQEFADAEQLGQKWRQEHGIGDRPVVLTLGRLDPRKNHAAVLTALGELARQGQALDTLYLVAGEGRTLPALKQQAQELGLADRVRFLGSVGGQTRLALFGACDVFAMPAVVDGSDVEGFGMVFVEAGACGKPSLAGCEGGQPEAVHHEQSGLVVDGTDDTAVTQALGKLLGDTAYRAKLGAGARQRAETLDWPRVVQRTLELVEKLN